MSLHRIDIPAKRTHGWQARVKLRGTGGRYLSQFFSDQRLYGRAISHLSAMRAERILTKFARSMGC